MLGWARAQLGSAGEGVALIRQGLAGLAEAGARLAITDHSTRLAEAQALDGKIDDALITIEEALQANPEELVFRPNALTCRGELRLKLGQSRTGRGRLPRGDRARTKDAGEGLGAARDDESRAAARDQQGRRDEARTMLAEIYNWFTEGFDTADLKDAKALLDELNG